PPRREPRSRTGLPSRLRRRQKEPAPSCQEIPPAKPAKVDHSWSRNSITAAQPVCGCSFRAQSKHRLTIFPKGKRRWLIFLPRKRRLRKFAIYSLALTTPGYISAET